MSELTIGDLAAGTPDELQSPEPMGVERSRTGPVVHELLNSFTLRACAFLLLHLPLAIVMQRSRMLSAAHALATLAIGLFFLVQDRTPRRVIWVAAYIAGAEVLWRATRAPVFWEYGKYSCSALLALALLKQRTWHLASKLPLVYLMLLLPSILAMPEFDREALSFNLSGPLALAVATMFFGTTALKRAEMRPVLLALMAPVASVAYLALSSMTSAGAITFSTSSLAATSAGFGPNQVSSMLGLGTLLGLLYGFYDRDHKALVIVVGVCAIWLGVHSALTFSRGGLWTCGAALIAALFYLFRDRRLRGLLLGTVVALVIAYQLIYPALNVFTGGMLAERFRDLDPTGRDEIVVADWYIFRDHFPFGVGPGEADALRARFYGQDAVTHTEYSRLLAEHGLYGLVALLLLLAMAAQHLRMRAEPLDRAFSVSLTVWALAFMLHAAMRLVAPSFVFGLAAVRLQDPGSMSDESGGGGPCL